MVYVVLMQHGIEIEVDGHIRNVKGTVMVLLADTLAAHQLGGFKVGVGFSLRKCRHCMATAEDIQSKVCICSYFLHCSCTIIAILVLCTVSGRAVTPTNT